MIGIDRRCRRCAGSRSDWQRDSPAEAADSPSSPVCRTLSWMDTRLLRRQPSSRGDRYVPLSFQAGQPFGLARLSRNGKRAASDPLQLLPHLLSGLRLCSPAQRGVDNSPTQGFIARLSATHNAERRTSVPRETKSCSLNALPPSSLNGSTLPQTFTAASIPNST